MALSPPWWLQWKGRVFRYALLVIVLSRLLMAGGYFEWTMSEIGWEDAATIQLKVRTAGGFMSTNNESSRKRNRRKRAAAAKFYILPMPEITTWLLGNFTEAAIDYYHAAMNEEQAEVWLHRGLEQLSDDRTDDPSEADVVILPGYLHFNLNMLNAMRGKTNTSRGTHVPYATKDWLALLKERLIPNKTHVVAIPTWNPTRGRQIGLEKIKKTLEAQQILTASFGFERNKFWQKTAPEQIIPVPYVVTPSRPRDELRNIAAPLTNRRTGNFVFYAGDARKRAVQWAGCDRTNLTLPLQDRTDMDVRVVAESNRLTQDQYSARMFTSEYCLILCGDTPTSRSLASSMLYGCIPVRVGSRLRGYCEAPCHAGWGWSVTNRSHLPFGHAIDWGIFPEVDEAAFSEDPAGTLDDLFRRTDSRRKDEIRSVMNRVQMAWAYGWGSPVNSTDFGDAVSYAWDSLVDYLVQTDQVTVRTER